MGGILGSRSPGWDDDRKLDEEVFSLLHLAPEHIRIATPDYWERARAGALIERIFDNLPNIENREDREKVARVYGKKGGSTPTFQILAKYLYTFIGKGTHILKEIAELNLEKIDIGEPFATSEEMLKWPTEKGWEI